MQHLSDNCPNLSSLSLTLDSLYVATPIAVEATARVLSRLTRLKIVKLCWTVSCSACLQNLTSRLAEGENRLKKLKILYHCSHNGMKPIANLNFYGPRPMRQLVNCFRNVTRLTLSLSEVHLDDLRDLEHRERVDITGLLDGMWLCAFFDVFFTSYIRWRCARRLGFNIYIEKIPALAYFIRYMAAEDLQAKTESLTNEFPLARSSQVIDSIFFCLKTSLMDFTNLFMILIDPVGWRRLVPPVTEILSQPRRMHEADSVLSGCPVLSSRQCSMSPSRSDQG
jgi:hypothetical protein